MHVSKFVGNKSEDPETNPHGHGENIQTPSIQASGVGLEPTASYIPGEDVAISPLLVVTR